jgi:hypothetical protein
MIVPVAKKYNIYAESVQATLVESGFFCDIDLSGKVMIPSSCCACFASYDEMPQLAA